MPRGPLTDAIYLTNVGGPVVSTHNATVADDFLL